MPTESDILTYETTLAIRSGSQLDFTIRNSVQTFVLPVLNSKFNITNQVPVDGSIRSIIVMTRFTGHEL